MMVSSTSTTTLPAPANSGDRAASPAKNLAATASSCRTWPKRNERRTSPMSRGNRSERTTDPSRRAATATCHRSNPHRRPSRPPARPPSTPHSRPCQSTPSDAHRPSDGAQQTRPKPVPGPGPPPTPSSAHRTPPTYAPTCEKVAPDGCPSSWMNRNLRQVPFSKPARASARYGTLTQASSSVDRGLADFVEDAVNVGVTGRVPQRPVVHQFEEVARPGGTVR